MASAQLRPVPQPLAVFEGMIARQTQILVVTEHGDRFDITTVEGRAWMNVNPKYPTVHGRKKAYDAQGNYLFDLIKKNWHRRTTFAVLDQGSKKQHMEFKSRFSAFGTKPEAQAKFTTIRGTPVKLVMQGKWPRSSINVVDTATGAVVGRIERRVSNFKEAANAAFGQQTYQVTVAPGVDTALMVALCICLDEKREEQQRR